MANTQYITDNKGKKIAIIIPIEDDKKLLEEVEELEDIRAYDEAKKEDNGDRIPFNEYIKKRNLKDA